LVGNHVYKILVFSNSIRNFLRVLTVFQLSRASTTL
jgi:hypothetical protein